MTATQPVFSTEEWETIVEHLGLAPRQEQTLRCLFDGMSDKQIALVLGIAVPTVRSYLQRLYAKHGVQDRTGLVVHIFREFRAIQQSDPA